MTDDELLASLPTKARTLLVEKWGKHPTWVECPTGEDWIYACILVDQGLLKMHVDTPPYFILTDLGRRVLPAIIELDRARETLR